MGDVGLPPKRGNGKFEKNEPPSPSPVDSPKASNSGSNRGKPIFFRGGRGRGRTIIEARIETNHEKMTRTLAIDTPGVINDLNFQLQRFITEVTMNRHNIDQREHVMYDLKRLLIGEFPQVQLHPFGSLITGLGDKDSDLDIYVDCNSNVKNGQVKPVDSNQKRNIFTAVHAILRRQAKTERLFGQIISISSARVPIIKTVHCATRISCDLSFENFLSVRNSRLIQLYTRIDPRVKPLMCLIRYWGKFHGLTDSSKIKNYGLILLIIVYLTQSRIVPSIYDLQNWNSNVTPCEIEDWNASFFDNDFLLLRHCQMTQGTHPDVSCLRILQLMQGFCRLYATFDSSKYVICSLLGEFLPRSSFFSGYEQELPSEMSQYKEWCYSKSAEERLRVSPSNAFIIQDPFVLNYNVSGVTSNSVLQKFQIACTKTVEFLGKFLSAPPATSRSAMLMDIFCKIDFPVKHRKISGTDTTKRNSNDNEEEEEENPLAGDKYVHKQLGFATRPTEQFCRAFWTQFSTCGLPAEEVVFRGSTVWLRFTRNFFLSFFQESFGIEVATVIANLPTPKFLGPPKPKGSQLIQSLPKGGTDVSSSKLTSKVLTSVSSGALSASVGASLSVATSSLSVATSSLSVTTSSLSVATPSLPVATSSTSATSSPVVTICSSSVAVTSTLEQSTFNLSVQKETNHVNPSCSVITQTQEENSSELDGLCEPIEDSDNESDDSSLSLSTIELISAIIQYASPREVLDSVDVSAYRPQRLSFEYHGLAHNIWKGRGNVSKQLVAESWEPGPSSSPLTREAEITKRLIDDSMKEEDSSLIPVAFECSVTLRPESYKDVYAEIQLRESCGLHSLPFLRAIKAAMLDNLGTYILYSLSQWTRELTPVVLEQESTSDASSNSTEKQKQKLRKKEKKKLWKT